MLDFKTWVMDKKILYILGFCLVMVACRKEVIQPNRALNMDCMHALPSSCEHPDGDRNKPSLDDSSNDKSTNPNGGGTTGTVFSDSTNSNGTGITDPNDDEDESGIFLKGKRGLVGSK